MKISEGIKRKHYRFSILYNCFIPIVLQIYTVMLLLQHWFYSIKKWMHRLEKFYHRIQYLDNNKTTFYHSYTALLIAGKSHQIDNSIYKGRKITKSSIRFLMYKKYQLLQTVATAYSDLFTNDRSEAFFLNESLEILLFKWLHSTLWLKRKDWVNETTHQDGYLLQHSLQNTKINETLQTPK